MSYPNVCGGISTNLNLNAGTGIHFLLSQKLVHNGNPHWGTIYVAYDMSQILKQRQIMLSVCWLLEGRIWEFEGLGVCALPVCGSTSLTADLTSTSIYLLFITSYVVIVLISNMSTRQFSRPVWHLIDARNQVVGRLATQITGILRGKHKPTFTPHNDCGDYVVVINAKDVKFTGKKVDQKLYTWHTGFPGGIKHKTVKNQLEDKPEEVSDHH